MNCDICGVKIGNTLYEIGEKRLCPVCWLGKEEGTQPKYQKFDSSWTETKLKAYKESMKK